MDQFWKIEKSSLLMPHLLGILPDLRHWYLSQLTIERRMLFADSMRLNGGRHAMLLGSVELY